MKQELFDRLDAAYPSPAGKAACGSDIMLALGLPATEATLLGVMDWMDSRGVALFVSELPPPMDEGDLGSYRRAEYARKHRPRLVAKA